jgi:integrase
LEAANNVNKKLIPIILLAIETGMRRGELCGLRWENVDIQRRIVFLPDTKNGEPRTVPLTTKASIILSELERRDVRVFPHCPTWVTRQFHAITKAADVKDFRFHDLRHEAISRLFELDAFNVVEIAKISGHKTISQLNRYTHLSTLNLVKRLP